MGPLNDEAGACNMKNGLRGEVGYRYEQASGDLLFMMSANPI